MDVTMSFYPAPKSLNVLWKNAFIVINLHDGVMVNVLTSNQTTEYKSWYLLLLPSTHSIQKL